MSTSFLQSVNMPFETHSPIRIDFPDGTCLLWATLALLQINEMVPIDTVSEALHFREAIGHILFSFSDAKDRDGRNSDALTDLKDELDVLKYRSIHYYEYDYECEPASVVNREYVPPSRADQEQFAYLFEILVQFHAKIAHNIDEHPVNAHDTYHMTLAIGELLHQITRPVLHRLFRTVSDLLNAAGHGPMRQHDLNEAIDMAISCATNAICIHISMHVTQQKALKTHGDFDRHHHVGEAFARLIHDPLQEQVYAGLAKLIQNMRTLSVHMNEESALIDGHLHDFFYTLAELFTYKSRMIHYATFGPEDSDDDSDYEGVPEYVRNHDFEQYEDNDWWARELVLVEVQDVLRGPESATLNDVSVVVATVPDTECSICSGTDTAGVMCEIRVCGHLFCFECLSLQLRVEHECRYKCSICRAEFFPEVAT
jgi:hypothetical protein